MSTTLKPLAFYQINKGPFLELKTFFNNETKYYESHFSNGLISKIKTKKLHIRNVLYWCEKYGFELQN